MICVPHKIRGAACQGGFIYLCDSVHLPQSESERRMISMVMKDVIHLFPVEDGACSRVSLSGKFWSKNYPSMPDATSEAVGLGMLPIFEKDYLNRCQLMPNFPHDLKREIAIRSKTLIKSGFHREAPSTHI
jgi:hypothetical protein